MAVFSVVLALRFYVESKNYEEKRPLKNLNRKLVPVEFLCLKSALRLMMIYHNGIMSLYLKWIPYDIFHDLSPSRVPSPKKPLVFRQQRVPG